MLVDAGNFSGYRDRYGVGRMKSELIARFMDWSGYDAVNIGEREIGFGLRYLRYLRDTLGSRLVSANVRAADGGEVASPWVLLDIEDVSVGVSGVVSTGFLKWTVVESLTVEEPASVLPEIVAELKRRCDIVVILACTRAAEARELAALSGADVVVTRPGSMDEEEPREGPPWVLDAGSKGEKIGSARFGWHGELLSLQDFRRVVLDETVPSDGVAQDMIEKFKTEAKLARAPGAPRSPQPGPRYLGQTSCAKCHPEIARRWARTAHATAMQTLVEKQRQSDPACIPCHVTGYGQPGGFRDMGATPWLAGVQCEVCHGPGSDHMTTGGGLPYGSVSALDCVRCHTVAQSPDFSYQRGDLEGIH